METFICPKKMVEDDRFMEKRSHAFRHLQMSDIDPPIRDIIERLKKTPHCFTLQSCHGHILEKRSDGDRFKRIDPESGVPDHAFYQIAYLALVLENSPPGRKMCQRLADISLLDKDFIQWGSAEWFWETRGFQNSYVIQVVPRDCRNLDRFNMDREIAQKWLVARKLFFRELREII